MNQPANRFSGEGNLFEGVLINSALDAIITVDVEGRILGFNPAAEQMFGHKEVDALSVLFGDVMFPSYLHDQHEETIQRLLESGDTAMRAQRFETEALRASGEIFPVEISITPHKLGGVPMFTTFLRDLTKRRQAEAALLLAKNEAERAVRSKSEFLANMSHELRTPLNAIMGFSDFIRTEMFGTIAQERYVTYADLIHGSGQHLLDLINDLLDMSKIEAGKTEIDPETLDLEATIRNCVQIVRAAADARAVAMSLDIDVSKIWADDRALRQVLINLLSNAIKFSHDGGEIAVSAQRIDAGVCLRVVDKGIGISEDFLPHLTQPFERSTSSFVASQSGTGLGLSIVKALMDLHGGSVSFDSQKGAGTTVEIIFPDGPDGSCL